jgi:RNA polymerase sigma-70 factor (ECF subfamily)
MLKRTNQLDVNAPEQPQRVKRHLPCLSGFHARLLARAQALMGPQLRVQLDPADIVHETLLKAYQALDQFRGDKDCQLAAWLDTILTNSIKNAIRSLRVMESYAERPQVGVRERVLTNGSCPVRAAIWNEDLRRLSKALAQLPQNQRAVLELRLMYDCSLAGIGNLTGRTRASVIGLLQRGLRKLRTLLTDSGQAPREQVQSGLGVTLS